MAMQSEKTDLQKPEGVEPERCGNCKFWQVQGKSPDGVEIGACFGAPPTPIMVAMRPRQFGAGVDMQFEPIRPALRANEAPCSLYQRKVIFDLGTLKRN